MRRVLLTLAFLCCALPSSAATAIVNWNEGFVNVRADATQSAKKLGTINVGEKVEILTQKGDWARVRYASGEGWVVVKSLKLTPERAAAKPPSPEPAPAPVPAPIAPPAPALAPTPAYNAPTPAPTAPGGYLSDVPEKPAMPEFSLGKTLVSMISGLLLVLGMIGGIVWLIRRFFAGRFPALQGANAIRVLASRPLAQRQALLLVEVGGEIYLISQSEGEVRLLSKIDSPNAVDRLDYLFSFKPTEFEGELRRELDVESREEEAAVASANGQPPAEEKVPESLSISERLARLRGRKS